MIFEPEEAKKLLAIRDALINDDIDEAYNQLYDLCNPKYPYDPWTSLERLARMGESEAE